MQHLARLRQTGTVSILVCIVLCMVSTGLLAQPTQAKSVFVPFHSKISPYIISYPRGWKHMTGYLPGTHSHYKYDAFIIPAPIHKSFVNVIVGRIPVPPSETDGSLLQAGEHNFLTTDRNVAEVGEVFVAGHLLTLISYTNQNAHTQAYLVQDGWAWIFALTCGIDDSPTWRPLFIAMLKTFQLR